MEFPWLRQGREGDPGAQRGRLLGEESGRHAAAGTLGPNPHKVPRAFLDHNFAVFDFETTGFIPERHDRVVEVAVVQLDSELEVEREYSTLVNPQRDLGATHIHGITGHDVRDAPPFVEVADDLVRHMRGRVLVAHNVSFDLRFLHSEFERLSYRLPALAAIDTMRLCGGSSLEDACSRLAIENPRAHRALSDARATAALLRALAGTTYQRARDLYSFGCRIDPPPAPAWPEIPGEDTEYDRSAVPPKHTTPAVTVEVGPGMRVCFTGTGGLLADGGQLDRNAAEELAASLGFEVKSAVTKKLDFLIAADPDSLSAKAKKARKYGILIVSFDDFGRSVDTLRDR